MGGVTEFFLNKNSNNELVCFKLVLSLLSVWSTGQLEAVEAGLSRLLSCMAERIKTPSAFRDYRTFKGK
jgi:hypothetical protein